MPVDTSPRAAHLALYGAGALGKREAELTTGFAATRTSYRTPSPTPARASSTSRGIERPSNNDHS
jgi:hypothetical protein